MIETLDGGREYFNYVDDAVTRPVEKEGFIVEMSAVVAVDLSSNLSRKW